MRVPANVRSAITRGEIPIGGNGAVVTTSQFAENPVNDQKIPPDVACTDSVGAYSLTANARFVRIPTAITSSQRYIRSTPAPANLMLVALKLTL